MPGQRPSKAPGAIQASARPSSTHSRTRWPRAASCVRNDSPDIYFEHSINPYRGCEHGCIYCYARPTHSYLNLSPGLDFETKLIAKRNIAEVLRAANWRVRRYLPTGIEPLARPPTATSRWSAS
jgi:DNA repair photolyase